MKLIITIFPDSFTDAVSVALTTNKFRVTQIASTGGFLRKGNSTLLIGVEDEQVQDALKVVKNNIDLTNSGQKGVAFVINVDEYVHF
ncbi:MAG: hypothetical protein GX933_06710 [Chloroflexi bacterium]|jgi:uncharacterized protein YaaQ|nr:hypothetical protein [Chloroflexota bacterium]